MAFPEDGDYVVPGALVPVHFKNGRGVYVEPNVWVRHPLLASGASAASRAARRIWRFVASLGAALLLLHLEQRRALLAREP